MILSEMFLAPVFAGFVAQLLKLAYFAKKDKKLSFGCLKSRDQQPTSMAEKI